MPDCQNGASAPNLRLPEGKIADRERIFRILDANLNRATEGYRVAEEYARFVLDDAFFARELKESRHRLVEGFRFVPQSGERLLARDSQGDVGANVSTESETRRASAVDVAAASFQRITQALRSLAEYGKVVSPEFAACCEALRYRAYTLEKAMLGARPLASRLASARVYVLIDGGANEQEFDVLASEVAAAADVIQLRDKKRSDRELLARAKRLRSFTRQSQCLFIMNDRPDLALLSDADGVHVGQEELGVTEARRILGPQAIVGVSTHSIEQLRQAILDGASYVGCGPTFPSTTKTFSEFAGLEYLKAAAAETSLPAFAIGGIQLSNVQQAVAAGFRRVAISGAIRDPQRSPREVIAAFRELLSAEGG